MPGAGFTVAGDGTTGSGKTVLISELVAQIRDKGERCVVYDKMGSYTRSFFDPARDVLLNPLDARAPRWCPSRRTPAGARSGNAARSEGPDVSDRPRPRAGATGAHGKRIWRRPASAASKWRCSAASVSTPVQ